MSANASSLTHSLPHFSSLQTSVGDVLFFFAGLQKGVIHGRWACWSTWSSCNGAQRSRSRSCSNPAPQNGGQHCSGEATETSDCDEDELSYLKLVYLKALEGQCQTRFTHCLCVTRTMEPQCFDQTLPESHKCGPPPPQINGYIMVNTLTLHVKAVGCPSVQCFLGSVSYIKRGVTP